MRQHLGRGGKLCSKGLAAGTGLTLGVALFAVVFGVISQQEKAQTGPSIHVDAKDEVYYAGTATKQEAMALGSRLKEDGFFTGQGGDVLLKKSAEGTSLSPF